MEATLGNRYNQVPQLAQNTTCKWQNTTPIDYLIQESQEVSRFPAGDHQAAMNRQESMTNTNIYIFEAIL